ncbi:MAG: hypothetical protein AVDCRST_MAG59-3798, partial [uncultured Thermomicrobiales bacterium]
GDRLGRRALERRDLGGRDGRRPRRVHRPDLLARRADRRRDRRRPPPPGRLSAGPGGLRRL